MLLRLIQFILASPTLVEYLLSQEIVTYSRVAQAFVMLLGASLAIASSSAPAQAFVPINQGTDYVRTPDGGAAINLDGTFYFFSGLPIETPTATPPDGGYSGLADTVINRLDQVTSSGGTTALEIVGLSLRGRDNPNLYVGLQKYLPGGSGALSTGSMDIFDSTWSSSFTIHGVVIATPLGTNPTGPDFVKDLIQNKCGSAGYACTNFAKGPFIADHEPYTRTPRPDQIMGENLVVPGLDQNFFIKSEVKHDAGEGTIHDIDPVPAPLPILGAAAILSGVKRIRKLSASLHQSKQRNAQKTFA